MLSNPAVLFSEVQMSQNGAETKIEVADSGSGIPVKLQSPNL